MFAKLSSVIVLALAALAALSVAVPTDIEAAGKPGHGPKPKPKVIADGKKLRIGNLKEKPWYYYADALIESGACPPHIAANIPGCYTITLPKQTNKGQIGQLRTPLVPADGSTYRSAWTSNIESAGLNVPGTEYFHLFEMFSSQDGPFSFVELRTNEVYFQNPYQPGNYSGPDPLFGFTDRNAFHELELVTGPNGKIDFNVSDKVTGERLLTFLWHGRVGGSDISVRIGATRVSGPNQTKFVEHIGDLYFAKVA